MFFSRQDKRDLLEMLNNMMDTEDELITAIAVIVNIVRKLEQRLTAVENERSQPDISNT